jgi:hypothetical protein
MHRGHKNTSQRDVPIYRPAQVSARQCTVYTASCRAARTVRHTTRWQPALSERRQNTIPGIGCQPVVHSNAAHQALAGLGRLLA